MNLQAIITKVKRLTKRELVDLCINNLEELEETLDNIDLSQINMTKEDINEVIATSVMVVMNSDGNVEYEEYELAKKIFNILDIECYNIEKFRIMCDQLMESGGKDAPKSIYSLLNIMDSDSSESKNLYIELLVCIALYNGRLDDKEIEMLENAINEGNQSTSNSSKNELNEKNKKNNETQNIKILRHNATLIKGEYQYYLSVGAELLNPNLAKVARFVEVKIVVKNSSGRILETSKTSIDCIDSYSKFYFGEEISIDNGVPSSYDIQVYCDSYVDSPEKSTFAKGIVTSHYNLQEDRWGDVNFTANVSNKYNENLRVSMFFVFYDSNDNITGGANTYVGTIYGHSEDNIDISLTSNVKRNSVRESASFDFFDLLK